MNRPVTVRRLRYGVLLLITAVLGLMVIGCNGGGGGSTVVAQAETQWKQASTATYVGTADCRNCHADIHDDYVQNQPMGNPAEPDPDDPTHVKHADEVHAGKTDGVLTCGACHVTGFGAPGGGKLDGSTPHLEGIGCENCHGPGSLHIDADSKAQRHETITRTPPDKVCWDCHGDRLSTPDGYRPGALNQPYKMVTEADYSTLRNLTVRGPHHPTAAMLLGWKGFNVAAPVPSPHSRVPNTCLGCHKPEVKGKFINHGADTWVPNTNTDRAECASCHQSGRADEHLVQLGINEMLIQLGGADAEGEPTSDASGGKFADYVTLHQLSLTTKPDLTNPAIVNYIGARHNYMYVRNEGSRGVHNPAFARRLLDDAMTYLSYTPPAN